MVMSRKFGNPVPAFQAHESIGETNRQRRAAATNRGGNAENDGSFDGIRRDGGAGSAAAFTSPKPIRITGSTSLEVNKTSDCDRWLPDS